MMSAATPATLAEDQGSVKSEDSGTGRAKFLCSYGGRIMPRPHDGLLRYVGGETRILSVHRNISFADLMAKLRKLCPFENVILKYQLLNEDLDALVSVISDEDLENMMEEYERIEAKDSSSRLRLFLFPACKQQENSTDPEHKFVEALNGVYRKPAAANLAVDVSPEDPQKKNNLLLLRPQQVLSSQAVAAAPPSGTALQVSSTPASGLVPQVSSPPSAGLVPQVSSPPASGLVPHVIAATPALQTQAPPQAIPPCVQQPVIASSVQQPQLIAAAPSQVPQMVQQVLPANVVPQVLPAQAARVAPVNTHNLVAVPSYVPPKVLATATPSVVRVATPSVLSGPSPVIPAANPVIPANSPQIVGAQAAGIVPHVIRPVPPQVLAGGASRPTYVPLVEVSRAMLPKGMVLRQFSGEEEHQSESVSSQNSQMNDVSSVTNVTSDRRDSGDTVDSHEMLKAAQAQDNVLLPHIPDPKLIRNEILDGKLNGTAAVAAHHVIPKVPAAVDTHLERYLVEQTMGELGAHVIHTPPPQVGFQLYIPSESSSVHRKFYEQACETSKAIPRAASAPALQSVDVPMVAATHGHHAQFQRQYSDRSEPQQHQYQPHQENLRLGPSEVIVHQLDDRFPPKPVLHPLNGPKPSATPTQLSDPTSHVVDPQLVQPPKAAMMKMVPQVVALNPYKVP